MTMGPLGLESSPPELKVPVPRWPQAAIGSAIRSSVSLSCTSDPSEPSVRPTKVRILAADLAHLAAEARMPPNRCALEERRVLVR
jgi:hypothetical protein